MREAPVLQVGNNSPAATIDSLASGIMGILQTGFDTHASQETLQTAITVLGQSSRIENVNIAGCTFDAGEKNITN